MDTPDTPRPPHSSSLSLTPADQWTLHHVLLDRIERETAATDPGAVEPPSIEVFQAFERIDAGDPQFTIAQLDAIQRLLAEYHHSSTAWELERPQLERLLHRVTDRLERHRSAPPAD